MGIEIVNENLARDLVLYNDALIKVFFNTLFQYLSRWGDANRFASLNTLGVFSAESPLSINNFFERYRRLSTSLYPYAYACDSKTESLLKDSLTQYLDNHE